MNKILDLEICGYREISIELTARECVELKKSLDKLVLDIRSKHNDIFSEIFINSVERRDIANACDFFNDLCGSNLMIKKHVILQEKYEKLDPLDQLLESDEYQDSSAASINLKIELRLLMLALNTEHLCYTSKLLHEKPQQDSCDMDDWMPPDSFKDGTDAEQEIWNDYYSKK